MPGNVFILRTRELRLAYTEENNFSFMRSRLLSKSADCVNVTCAVLVHLWVVVRWGSPCETLMTKPLERNAIYLKRHIDAETIVLRVRRYDL